MNVDDYHEGKCLMGSMRLELVHITFGPRARAGFFRTLQQMPSIYSLPLPHQSSNQSEWFHFYVIIYICILN